MIVMSGACPFCGNQFDSGGDCHGIAFDKPGLARICPNNRNARLTITFTTPPTYSPCPCCNGTGRLRPAEPGEMVDVP